MALQTTWNLDQTCNSLIGVSKGALHAATTNNVQPLAILACEQFGNTLAMSPATLRKIEHSVLPVPEPRMLSFVKATVGWSKNDCISYFGQNIAGLQFLGLAAALVTHADLYRAAQTLQGLLASTANDKTLLPTARQITHLLASLESRCHLAGFADDVEGWRLLLAKHPSIMSDPAALDGLASPRPIPSSDAMVSLVDALRQLSRVGGADITGVTLITGTCLPWIIGFVKWSLGQPPTIRCEANGNTLLEQPDSRVTVIISKKKWPRDELSITIHSSIHSPSELLVPGAGQQYAGMVVLQTYGQGLLHDHRFTSGLAKEAFQQAMPSALCQAMARITSRSYSGENWPEGPDWMDMSGPMFSLKEELGFSPFRSYEAILRIYRLLFDHELPMEVSNSGQNISSLHHVALLIESCQCETCAGKRDDGRSIPCLKRSFFAGLGYVVADVLALSLINEPEHLRVSASPRHVWLINYNKPFHEELSQLLKGESVTRIGLRSVLERCLGLLGHHNGANGLRDWAVISAKGQAVWPTIFETLSSSKQGFASVSWYPGLVRHNGETFTRVTSSGATAIKSQMGIPGKVKGPCHMFPNIKWQWMLSMDGGRLDIGLEVTGDSSCNGTGIGVCRIIPNLSSALLVGGCPHSPDADLELELPLERLGYSGPFFPYSPNSEISIVAVDGDADLRFLALVGYEGFRPIVLRDKACMACCLDVCKKVGARVLIL